MSIKGIYLKPTLIKSPAWLSLTGASQSVYLLFRLRCKMERIKTGGKPGMRTGEWIIANNGEIIFTYIEAKRDYGISRKQFRDAIDDLISKGFIDIAKSGRGIRQIATLYTISDRWWLFGRPDFKKAARKKAAYNPGFKKGNTLSPRNKKIPSVQLDTSKSVKSDTVATTKTPQNGKVEKYPCNRNGDKYLRKKTPESISV